MTDRGPTEGFDSPPRPSWQVRARWWADQALLLALIVFAVQMLLGGAFELGRPAAIAIAVVLVVGGGWFLVRRFARRP
ncbi:hypothetical protein ACFQ15_10560 [Sphingomonas hankookensis]|uniref:hypothetical protein n=1 Tax=Sphingomonas hankookensis TaxID=563996 RepID=UPI001F5979C5|nr:hypothetical protein [Sphingomonas hankookensis]